MPMFDERAERFLEGVERREQILASYDAKTRRAREEERFPPPEPTKNEKYLQQRWRQTRAW